MAIFKPQVGGDYGKMALAESGRGIVSREMKGKEGDFCGLRRNISTFFDAHYSPLDK